MIAKQLVDLLVLKIRNLVSIMLNYLTQFAKVAVALLYMVWTGSCAVGGGQSPPSIAKEECVVLLHGMGRTYRSMQRLESALRYQGYHVANIDYPSTEYGIEELADVAVSEGISFCEENGANVVHFVTHSLGGIITRYYLKTNELENLGKVVMLGPPNQGSEVTDVLEDTFFYQRFFGPAGQQLGTGDDSFVNSLGPVLYPVGIIVGSESAFFDRYFSDIIPGEDDGKVSVERAKLEGMADFIVLPYAHPYIMDEDEVISQTLYFLEHGSFQHKSASDMSDPETGEQ